MSFGRPKAAKGLFGSWSALLLLAGLLLGCAPEEAVEPPAPAPVAFEGSLDPKYVGNWSTANKNSQLTLDSDGKASMVNVAQGRGTSKATGEWKLSGKDLLFRVDGAEGGHVSRYAAQITGDRLRLKQKSTKLDIEYRRTK